MNETMNFLVASLGILIILVLLFILWRLNSMKKVDDPF